MTPREALDRIAALHTRGFTAYPSGEGKTTAAEDVLSDGCQFCQVMWPCETAEILAEVSPEPGGTTSDDHQRGYAQGYTEGRAAGWDERGALGGTLDGDQAREVLDRFRRGEQGIEVTLDHLAQFVRPVAGVTLTPGSEQARVVQWALRRAVEHAGNVDVRATAVAIDRAIGEATS